MAAAPLCEPLVHAVASITGGITPSVNGAAPATGTVGVVAGQAEARELGRLGGIGGRIAGQHDRRSPIRIFEPHASLLMLALIVTGLAVRSLHRVGPGYVMARARQFGEDRPAAPLCAGVTVTAGTGAGETAVVAVARYAGIAGVVLAGAAIVAMLVGSRMAHLAHAVVGRIAVGVRVGARSGSEGDALVSAVGRRDRGRDHREVAASLTLVVVAVPAARRRRVLRPVVYVHVFRDRDQRMAEVAVVFGSLSAERLWPSQQHKPAQEHRQQRGPYPEATHG